MNRFRSITDSVMRLPWLFLIPWAAFACDCQTSYRPCHELGVSDLVFVGSVESITPAFLNRWNLGNGSSLKALNELYTEAQDHPAETALNRLKEGYERMFPDLGPDTRHELEQAKTVAAVTAVFYTTLNRGIRVRFKVRTLYKHEEDDDADKPEDEDSFDVTPFNDCGLDFQPARPILCMPITMKRPACFDDPLFQNPQTDGCGGRSCVPVLPR